MAFARTTAFLAALALYPWATATAAEWATLVLDVERGLVLQAERAVEPRYPASLTKMMTAYLVLREVKAGRLAMTDGLTVSDNAAAQPATKLGLRATQRITVEQALKAMIVRSANDAAVVLAEGLAGSGRGFVIMMSAEAKALGMHATSFRNATGLHDAGQVSSARDMALLARALMTELPEHYRIFSLTSVAHGKRVLPSVNGWMSSYPGAEGIKTGFTCAAGYNLVAAARRGGARLVAVVLGGTSSGARNLKATQLLNAAFARLAAGAEGMATPLAELARTSGAARAKAAPFVLPGGACRVSATPEPDGRLEGWGIIFGAFKDRAAARAQIAGNKAVLGALAAGAEPAVIPRTREGLARFAALLVGLEKDAAGAACKRLWTRDTYCLRLPPAALNNDKALWR